MSVLFHVKVGLPLFLLPPSGVQVREVLGCLFWSMRKICPSILSRRSLMVVERLFWSVRRRMSSFLILSLQVTPNSFRRHLWWKTSILCAIFSVIFQVSLAYIATGITRELSSVTLLLRLMRFDVQIELSFRKTALAFPSRLWMSCAVSPLLEMLLPRYVKLSTSSAVWLLTCTVIGFPSFKAYFI